MSSASISLLELKRLILQVGFPLQPLEAKNKQTRSPKPSTWVVLNAVIPLRRCSRSRWSQKQRPLLTIIPSQGLMRGAVNACDQYLDTVNDVDSLLAELRQSIGQSRVLRRTTLKAEVGVQYRSLDSEGDTANGVFQDQDDGGSGWCHPDATNTLENEERWNLTRRSEAVGEQIWRLEPPSKRPKYTLLPTTGTGAPDGRTRSGEAIIEFKTRYVMEVEEAKDLRRRLEELHDMRIYVNRHDGEYLLCSLQLKKKYREFFAQIAETMAVNKCGVVLVTSTRCSFVLRWEGDGVLSMSEVMEHFDSEESLQQTPSIESGSKKRKANDGATGEVTHMGDKREPARMLDRRLSLEDVIPSEAAEVDIGAGPSEHHLPHEPSPSPSHQPPRGPHEGTLVSLYIGVPLIARGHMRAGGSYPGK